MRITSGIFYNKILSLKKIRPTQSVCSKPLYSKSVEQATNIEFKGLPTLIVNKIASLFNNPLKNFKDFSIEEYNSLSGRQIKKLRKRFENLSKTDQGYFYKNSEIIHDKVSEVIKNNLDNTYGKGNYKVITIGRSLSSIGKVLGYKIGEEKVINIPFSNARKFKSKCELNIDSGEKNIIMQNLSKIGLSKDSVINSDKKYVIMDYCLTGESLQGATNLFKTLFDNSENIVSLNPETIIENPTLKFAYGNCMVDSVYKKFSFSDKTEALSDISDKYKNVQKADYETKLMWFKLLDNCVSKKKLDLKNLRTDSKSLLKLDI